MNKNLKIANSILDLIGEIPLVRLNQIGKETGVEILVKPEFLNPSGSIKDRTAKIMIEEAERQGLLVEGSTIIEATTGNMGTALAFVSAVKGYKMIAFAPTEVADMIKSSIMASFGCKVEKVDIDAYEAESQAKGRRTSSLDNSIHGGFVELLPRQICLDMERETPNVWWARQFSNPFNTAAHHDWTAKEILNQTDGKLDAFVASTGTGGTLLGVAQALKEHDKKIKIISVEPSSWPVLEAMAEYPIIPGISGGILIEILESGLVDQIVSVNNDEAVDMAHQLAQKEGMFCGMSSGANVVAAVRIAKQLGPGKRIIVVLPDSRDRYLQHEIYTT